MLTSPHYLRADERVSSNLKQQIVQARTAKKMTQAQLAQVSRGPRVAYGRLEPWGQAETGGLQNGRGERISRPYSWVTPDPGAKKGVWNGSGARKERCLMGWGWTVVSCRVPEMLEPGLR